MRQFYQRSFDELRRIVADTELFFADNATEQGLRTPVDPCIEELFVNRVTYNTETEEQILLQMRPSGDGIEIELTDFDVERFDPAESAQPKVDAPLSDRPPGGSGLYLVMKMVDAVHYEYVDRKSKISLKIKASE